jgi:phage shock protein A
MMDRNELQALILDIEKKVERGMRKLTKDEEKLLAQARQALANGKPKISVKAKVEPAKVRKELDKATNAMLTDLARENMTSKSAARCLRTEKVQEMDRRLAKMLGGEILDENNQPVTVSIPDGRVN